MTHELSKVHIIETQIDLRNLAKLEGTRYRLFKYIYKYYALNGTYPSLDNIKDSDEVPLNSKGSIYPQLQNLVEDGYLERSEERVARGYKLIPGIALLADMERFKAHQE